MESSTLNQQHNLSLENWREQEKTALKLLQIVGQLRFDKSVELIFFRKDLHDSRPSEVLNIHKGAKKFTPHVIAVEDSFKIAEIISRVEHLSPSKIDVGKLAKEWNESGNPSLTGFILSKISDFINVDNRTEAKDVVLYGFGRIGRLVARRIVEQTGRGEQLRLKAIVLRPKLKDVGLELQKRAALLAIDSVHGKFNGVVDIDVEQESLIINGNRVKVIFARQPEDIDYTQYGISNALVIDNTGVWRDKEGLSRHLRPGAKQVLLTAPGKGVKNIVHGVNQSTLALEEDAVFSAASCTTNAISPVLQVLKAKFGVEEGHIETIHAYTNDQNLIDNFHKKPRRGRGAPINMVLTETGAAKAVSKVIPSLEGKLTGNAVRVPVPNVSLAILNLSLGTTVEVEQINTTIREAALSGQLVEQIHYSDSNDYVSSDAVGMTSTSVFDAPSTIVSADKKKVTLYLWYDNEYGYSCQVVRLAKYAAKVRRLNYY